MAETRAKEIDSQKCMLDRMVFTPSLSIGVPRNEELLNSNPRWTLSEGSRHFEEHSAVFRALNNISQRLHDLGISYAVIGGMALFHYGLRRFTEFVDILVTKDV